ncbi:DUF6291 domain-containing protein [Capnocytophaga granulosa]|uniref:DUF6291 domain-containing protein n=1 Tax=Capnocytophaga granulosa TaxID=45242 RepID=UPI0028D14538|nr:DUF6291 domain-containing protein [Capnocytophaga granulosa]
MKKETFLFYADWLNVIRDLPSEVQLEVYQAIAEYAIYGNLIELKPLAKVAFGFVKQTIDRDTQKYISISEKRSEAGKKGGRRLKDNELEESNEKQKKQLLSEKSKKSNCPLNDNDNVNDNDNDFSFLEKKKQKSASVDFEEEEKNNQPLSDQKETSPRVAAAPPPFNFKQAMLSAGFAADLTEDWLRIRKTKKAVNSERAFKIFLEQVQRTGQDKNTILALVVQKQWKGFEASWVQSAQQSHNPQEPVIIDQNGNIISGTHTTNTAGTNVVGRQTAADIAANRQGW